MSTASISLPRGGTLRRIPLDDLLTAPGHARRMAPRTTRALADHIAASGLYPPLIVRPSEGGKYEIIDGHHRAVILRKLGVGSARCDVWQVDDISADIYAATLNDLRGRPGGKMRAKRLRRLMNEFGPQRTAQMLALTPASIRQQLAALDPPRKRASPELMLDLRAVTFHLSPADARRLDATLQKCSQGRSRSQALLEAIAAAPDQAQAVGGQ